MGRTADDLARELARDEPRTTMALGTVLWAREKRGAIKVLRVGPGGRTVCPVVRLELGSWVACPVLADLADAPALAAAIDRSVARGVEGASVDVDPLLPHLRRYVSHETLERVLWPWRSMPWRDPKPVTRMATALDLPALYDLYEGYELGLGRTARAVRRELDASVERFGVVVLDGDGRLDGAIIASTRTPRFIEWSMMTVRPEVRSRGSAWTVMDRAIAVTIAARLGILGVLGPGNGMTVPPEFGPVDFVTQVALWLPDRVRGERRIRRLWFTSTQKRDRRALVRVRRMPVKAEREIAGP